MARTITVQEQSDIAIVSNICSAMMEKDGKLSVTVKKYDETLSDKQRKIYFKWVGIIGGELGDTKDEQHLTRPVRWTVSIHPGKRVDHGCQHYEHARVPKRD